MTLLGPDGRIRQDDEAIALVAAALRRDERVNAIVRDVGSRPVARGFSGSCFPAVVRDTGADALIKVNAAPYELEWLPAIHAVDPQITPAVFGSGESVGGHAICWIAMEHLPFVPPGFGGPEWYGPLLRAAFRWQDAASSLDLEPVHAIDAAWISSWIDAAIELDRSAEVMRLRERFDEDWAWVSDVCPSCVHHGDVHFFNAGSRAPGVPDTLVLFDPIPRSAPWPFDAANCHALTNYAGDRPLVHFAAEHRRSRGLPTPDEADVERVSTLFCAWLAVMWRALFRETQEDRRTSAAAHVERALRS